MTDSQSEPDMWNVRPNVRDPLTEQLIGPGKPFEIEEVTIAGHRQQIFKGAPRNLAAIYRRAARHAARDLVVHDDQRFTYADIFARAASLGAVLKEQHGVKPGAIVALAIANSAEFVIGLIAITSVGAVASLINSRGAAEEMLRAIAMGDCQVAILDAARADIIAAHTPDPSWTRIVTGKTRSPLRPQDMDFTTAAANAGKLLDPVETDSEAPAIILFTSGTTGFPKGAVLSHGAVAHSVMLSSFVGTLQDLRYEIENGERLPDNQKSMTSPAVVLQPMFHLSGIIPVLRSISVGTTIHIIGKWNVDVAFDLIEKTGMSRLSFVPAMLWDIFRSPRATPNLLSQIRYMVNGGAPLNPELVAEIRARTPKVLLANTYGQSENCAWATTIAGRPYLENPDSCGYAVPTVRVAIRREDGSEADIGERGEIWTSGASTMSFYLGDPQATAETLRDGWLATGDIGHVNEQGLFFIVDRKKNMVISGGENIYCAEVERVLSQHPAVLECLTYGLPDDRLGERLVAEIYADPVTDLDADAIKAHCRQHLAIYKVPREVIFREAPLPRTASGKIERRRKTAG